MSASAASFLSAAASSASSTAPLSKRQRDDDGKEEDDEQTHRSPPAQPAAVPRRVYLHRHALEFIFACLDIAGLATVMTVSRDWQAAVGSMRSISHRYIASPEQLMSVYQSRMRHHVTGICPRSVNLDILTLLHSRMPHLTQLKSYQLRIASEVLSLPWPPRLQELDLQDASFDVQTSSMLLRSIAGLSHLRRLSLSVKHDASLSFEPLARLPLLRHLDLSWSGQFDPVVSSAQVEEFRALVDLETFRMWMAPALLTRLLRPPHTLRWQWLPRLHRMDDAAFALLPTLACLTDLHLYHESSSHFDFLPRMQGLSILCVGLSPFHPSAAAATQSLVDALHRCSHITSLCLSAEGMPIASEQLAACLPGMPALNSFEIWYASLQSLGFLAAPSLTLSLQQLRLAHFRAPRPLLSELRHIHGLESLRRLMLVDAFATPLDAPARAPFQPPSALLPKLESFEA